jgi:hypothetical protein
MWAMPDALTPLLHLADVADAFTDAQQAADAAMRHRALRRSGGRVAAEIGLRAATASAALEGYPHDLDEVRNGTVTDPVVQGALRVNAALDGLADRWPTAPRQVLARLHTLAAAGAVREPALGRPRTDVDAGRLDLLCDLITGPGGAPALLRAAVIHGELLALRAFAGPNGLVARAAARLTMISSGLDPRGLLGVEIGHYEREPEYRGTAGSFATGTPDGLRAWLRHCASATGVAAERLAEVCDSVE